jgi:hypothetical protein
MVFKSSWTSALAGTVLLFIFLVSCEDDLDTIGDGVIASEPFNTDKAEFDVFAFNRSAIAVQTNRLPLYQIGVYDDPFYGRREAKVTTQISFPGRQGNPVFGNFTQDLEDLPEASRGQDTIPENETVKQVLLYLPYQQTPATTNDRDNDGVPDELESPEDRDDPNSDQDNDGLSDLEERAQGTDPFNPDTDGDGINDGDDDSTIQNTFANTFSLDSILSKRFIGLEDQAPYVGEEFVLKVERSTFFLRDLDPGANFEENQQYFSNTDITSFVDGDPLFEGTVIIDNKEIVTFLDDDPDTEEDESLIVDSRLAPGVQVALDPDFFQENILDKEGSFELLSQSNLSEFIRGLHISLTSSNEDLMILFDLTQANITITYEFDDFVRDDTGDDDDERVERVERDFTLNLLQVQNNVVFGNAVNTFVNDPLPSEVMAQLDNDQENASRLYLKGGSGTFSELRLFDNDASMANQILEEIKANNWVINEANLIFYVDRDALDLNGGAIEPQQLYLYDTNSNLPLYDGSSTAGFTSVDDLLEETFGGNLEKGSDGLGTKYSIRITDYINNLVIRDSILSPIALSVTSNLAITNTQEAESVMGEKVNLPIMNTLNPLGTVLFGNNLPLEDEEKKLKLQIFYTETN